MMKKLILSLTIFCAGTLPAIAQKQQQAEQILGKQYADPLHRELIHRISPQTKFADSVFIARFSKGSPLSGGHSIHSAAGDTSWRYGEYKLAEDSIWVPRDMYYLYTEKAGEEEFNHYYQEIQFTGQTEFHTSQLQRTHSVGDFTDSTISMYYNDKAEITYGSRFINKINPSEGASRETKMETYNPAEKLWEMQNRTLYYTGELYDTLTVEYHLDYDTKAEYVGAEFRYQINENYQLGDYRYFAYVQDGGTRYTSWYYTYTLLGEGGRYIYSVQKNLNSEGTGLANQDSLAYDYSSDGIVAGLRYSWLDSLYVLREAYDTFYSDLSGITVSDSLVFYAIVQNPETGEYEKGEVRLKTVFGYNEKGQQTLVRSFADPGDGNGLRLLSETHTEYNSSDLLIRRTGYYTLDGALIKNYETYNHYDQEGVWWYSQTLNFNEEGGIFYGTRDELAVSDKDNFDGFKYFSWDTGAEDWKLVRYRITRLPAGEGITQSSDYTVTERGYMQRSINNNYSGVSVAVLNDGPLHVEDGDTLLFYISAREIDGSIPEVEISGLPEGAEFDPESRRFFWAVQNASDGSMTVRAAGKHGESETVVSWYTGRVSTDTERKDKLPGSVRLEQNYPNPFNPVTTIRFEIPQTAETLLEVFNLTGQKVAVVLNQRLQAGSYSVQFDASGLSSGIYIYSLKAAGIKESGKMLLLK